MFAFQFLTLSLGEGAGEGGDDIDSKALEQLSGVVEKAVKNATKELETSYEGKLKEAGDQIKNLNDEVTKVKALANSSEASKKALDTAMDNAVVNVFKEVGSMSSVSEKEFDSLKQEIWTKILAAGDLTWGTDGAGLNIFEKFETDLIYEIEKFEAIKEFRNINLAKGSKITWTTATNGIVATFVDEKGMPTESEPVFDRISIEVKKIIALVAITQELEEDQMTTPQLYRLILEFSGEAIAELLEKEILSGDGTAFVGIFNLPWALTYTMGAGETVSDVVKANILAIEQKLSHKERAKAIYFMSDFSRYELGKVQDANGNDVFPKVFDANPTIMGRKIRISDYAWEVQDLASNVADASFLALGNPKQYLVVHRTGVTVAKGFYGDNWAKEIASIKVRKRGWMGSLKDTAFVIASNGS